MSLEIFGDRSTLEVEPFSFSMLPTSVTPERNHIYWVFSTAKFTVCNNQSIPIFIKLYTVANHFREIILLFRIVIYDKSMFQLIGMVKCNIIILCIKSHYIKMYLPDSCDSFSVAFVNSRANSTNFSALELIAA